MVEFEDIELTKEEKLFLKLQEERRNLTFEKEKLEDIAREIKDKMYLIEAKELIAVSMEEDEKGKKKYPNEQLRKAALTVRLAENEEYQKLKKRYREIIDKIDREFNSKIWAIDEKLEIIRCRLEGSADVLE